MRRLIEFPCAGETLFGTLDEGEGETGLLIVSGGNEIRCGAHRGMALLAADLARDGTPVFRFDRRGVGDSTGANGGFLSSAPDIAAAAATFSAETRVKRLVAFGNCDAATALGLFHASAGLDALIFANPWMGDEPDALPPASAIRAHYAERVRDPATWLRALGGGVSFSKFFRGLRKSGSKSNEQRNPLAAQFADSLGPLPRTILLARRDNTAMRFLDEFPEPLAGETRIVLDTASHSFARDEDQGWLTEQVRAAIAAS